MGRKRNGSADRLNSIGHRRSCSITARLLASAPLPVLAFFVLAGAGAFGASLVRAHEVPQPASATRIAAIGSKAPAAEQAARPAFTIPAFPPADIETDLRLLLAQSEPASADDGKLRDDTILVAFATTAPENAEEEVAKEHGLELVDRTELSALGMRIARYRIRDNRPIAAVVALLRTDQRVRQAPGNFEYRPVPPSTPATEVSGLKDRPVAEAKPDNRLGGPALARPARKTVVNLAEAAGAAKTVRPSKDDRGKPTNASAEQPLQIGKVGDVLAGGL